VQLAPLLGVNDGRRKLLVSVPRLQSRKRLSRRRRSWYASI
jgi:hypothetical protein